MTPVTPCFTPPDPVIAEEAVDGVGPAADNRIEAAPHPAPGSAVVRPAWDLLRQRRGAGRAAARLVRLSSPGPGDGRWCEDDGSNAGEEPILSMGLPPSVVEHPGIAGLVAAPGVRKRSRWTRPCSAAADRRLRPAPSRFIGGHDRDQVGDLLGLQRQGLVARLGRLQGHRRDWLSRPRAESSARWPSIAEHAACTRRASCNPPTVFS